MYVWVLIMYYDVKDIEEGIAVEVEDNLKSRSTPAEKVRTLHVCTVCIYVCMYVSSLNSIYTGWQQVAFGEIDFLPRQCIQVFASQRKCIRQLLFL